MNEKKSPIHASLQWKLTLLLTLLMTVSCILMYFFISHSAVSGIDELQNYIIQVDPQEDESPITFSIDPLTLFPQLQEEIQATKEQFLLRSVIATAVIILLSSLCTYWLTRRTLQPLRKLNQEISQIQAQNLSSRLAVPDTKDEIAQLTGSFNEMLTRLDNAFSIQKQFSANAAHELRTPLAVLQTNLEVFQKKKEPQPEEYQQLFSMIQEQTARLSHLVGTLLDMTNLKSVPRTDQVSLAELTDEVFCDLDSIAQRAGITLLLDSQDCTVTGSYVLLYRAVYNLVENAIKYNRPDGTVTVTIRPENDHALILVQDTGIGISPENQEKIFHPFFRVDKSRSRAMGGAGLGLALVDAIAREHDGQVKVQKSNDQGSLIAFILPVTQ